MVNFLVRNRLQRFLDLTTGDWVKCEHKSSDAVRLKRKPGANPGRARRCNRGRTSQVCHWLFSKNWEGAISRTNRKSEDLSERSCVAVFAVKEQLPENSWILQGIPGSI